MAVVCCRITRILETGSGDSFWPPCAWLASLDQSCVQNARTQPRPSNCVQVFLPPLAPSPRTLSSTLTQQQTTGAAAHPAPSTASSSPACTSHWQTRARIPALASELGPGPGSSNQSNLATAKIWGPKYDLRGREMRMRNVFKWQWTWSENEIYTPYTFRNNAIIVRMSESDPTGALDVDTEVGANTAGEDNTHSGKTGQG